MRYITIDGDDVGRRITSSYLSNDLGALIAVNKLVNNKTLQVADFLRSQGYVIVFCAADGVAAYCQGENIIEDDVLFNSVSRIANNEMTFSVGVGNSLRESYVALLAAKSNGKNQLMNFANLI